MPQEELLEWIEIVRTDLVEAHGLRQDIIVVLEVIKLIGARLLEVVVIEVVLQQQEVEARRQEHPLIEVLVPERTSLIEVLRLEAVGIGLPAAEVRQLEVVVTAVPEAQEVLLVVVIEVQVGAQEVLLAVATEVRVEAQGHQALEDPPVVVDALQVAEVAEEDSNSKP